MEGSTLGGGVRKGAWTKEEDDLLKSCVQKYGVGKWHLVPLRAGLNRCRKSCRLRWVNYLEPNIKRGEFSFDEVDLIIRLHRLLGNRWSLISGRVPGRTANDIKNYWNTKLCKKMISDKSEEEVRTEKYETHTKSTIIKPRPWTFSKKSLVSFGGNNSSLLVNVQAHSKSVEESQNNPSNKPSPPPSFQEDNNAIEAWWEGLFVENNNIGDIETATPPINWSEVDEHNINIVESVRDEEEEEVQTAWAAKVGQGGVFCVENGQSSFWNCTESSSSIFDVDLWK